MKLRTTAHDLSAADIERLNALRSRSISHDDDNPPLTSAQFAQAVRHRGRPRGSRKARVTVRIDNDVVMWLKRGGRGYQTRINDLLRLAMERTGARQ
jgi:uncharacterized protein (DUF4415 family)